MDKINWECNIWIVPWAMRLWQHIAFQTLPTPHPSYFHSSSRCFETDSIESACAQQHTQQANNREQICYNGSPVDAPGCFSSVQLSQPVPGFPQNNKKKGSVVLSKRRRDCGSMAEAELQTFTSIMDALVRISVSMTLILLRHLFQPRVLWNDTPVSPSFVPPLPTYIFNHT